MKTRLITCIFVCGILSVEAIGEVVLNAVPVDHVIRVGEPVNYNLEIINTGETAVSGVFVPTKEGFARLQLRIHAPNRESAYIYSIDDAMDAVDYRLVQLQPGERREGLLRVLYNMPADWFVFVSPGQYNLRFSLAGVVAIATVTVLDWDEVTDRRSIEASKLWMQRPIAYVYQLRRGELSPDRLEDLRRLTTEYGDTVYAKWAAKLLEWIENPPPPRMPEDYVRPIKTIIRDICPRRLESFGLPRILRRYQAMGRLSIAEIDQSIQWAEEYLEAEKDRLIPEDRSHVERYLKLLFELRGELND